MFRRSATLLVSQVLRSAGQPSVASQAAPLAAACTHGAAAVWAQPAGAWAPLAFQHLPTRGFTSSSPTCDLPAVLAEEISVEKESYAKPKEIESGPPAPFTLSETTDDTLLKLTRSYKGETVSIDLHVNNQPAQELGDENENESGEALSTVAFNVTVSKAGSCLVFECESDGTYVSINHMSHEPSEGHPSESFYTGPVFGELDEVLQAELRQYIQDRGVTEELGEYLRHLIFDKEQREYMAWLSKVHAFVK
ncbi:hypothetical protein FOA52_012362 [Chlamydomonas sp. UWO 241]|nr:hypothetical protein FOA52_012362 [Chlamydomonas sp. UWO 241]